MQTRKTKTIKGIITALLIAFMFLPDFYIAPTASFYHANWVHLLANIYVLWLIHFSWKSLAVAYIIATIAFTICPESIGFSAILYALIGLRIPYVRISRTDWALFIIANLITLFIPNVTFSIHAFSFFAAWALSTIQKLGHEYGDAMQGR